MPRPRKRPKSAPAEALPASQANLNTDVERTCADRSAAQPPGQHRRDAAGTRVLTPLGSPTTAPALPQTVTIGVGLDTSRYGHHASFLGGDLENAAADLDFVESGAGY